MSDNKVVPFSELELSDFDLNLAVKQGQKMISILKSMGIKDATFNSGAHFNNEVESNSSILATKGIVIRENKFTTEVVFRNKGSTTQQALQEMSTRNMTQKTLGAFSGISQQRASEMLLDYSDS